jgi:hypothetical protein
MEEQQVELRSSVDLRLPYRGKSFQKTYRYIWVALLASAGLCWKIFSLLISLLLSLCTYMMMIQNLFEG